MKTAHLHLSVSQNKYNYDVLYYRLGRWQRHWHFTCAWRPMPWEQLQPHLPRWQHQWQWSISYDHHLVSQQSLSTEVPLSPEQADAFIEMQTQSDSHRLQYDYWPLGNNTSHRHQRFWLVTADATQVELTLQHHQSLPKPAQYLSVDSLLILSTPLPATTYGVLLIQADHMQANFMHQQQWRDSKHWPTPQPLASQHAIEQWRDEHNSMPCYLITMDSQCNHIAHTLQHNIDHCYWWQPIVQHHFVSYCAALRSHA